MDGLDSVELIRDLTLNLVSIFVLVFMIYFRRHRRWDQVVGYVAFNISLFTVSAALGASGPINVGVGFGLFAVLSVVRLRSEESGQIEIGFTMVALVLGLMAGMPGMGFQIKIIFASLLVVTMFFIDIVSFGSKSRYQRIKIELDVEGQKVSREINYDQYLEIKKFHPTLDPIEMEINYLQKEIERGI